MNKKTKGDTNRGAMIGLLIMIISAMLFGSTLTVTATSFNNEASKLLYQVMFEQKGEPIEAPEKLVNKLNTQYQQVQKEKNYEFGYCLKIDPEEKKIIDYQEATYPEGLEQGAVLMQCNSDIYNARIHSHPQYCSLSNRDIINLGKHSYRYTGVICAPNQMFVIDQYGNESVQLPLQPP